MRTIFAGPQPLAWGEADARAQENWRCNFDEFVAAASDLGLRVEDDQSPHGPDVAPPAALKHRGAG